MFNAATVSGAVAMTVITRSSPAIRNTFSHAAMNTKYTMPENITNVPPTISMRARLSRAPAGSAEQQHEERAGVNASMPRARP